MTYMSYAKINKKAVQSLLIAVVLLSLFNQSASANTGASHTQTIYAIGIDVDRITNGRCGDTCDYYIRGDIDGMRFNNEDTRSQNLMENRNNITASWQVYKRIGFRPKKINLNLQLMDEDGGFHGSDDALDITPNPRKRNHHAVTVNFESCYAIIANGGGVFYGDFDSKNICQIPIDTEGTIGDRARISYKIVGVPETKFINPTYVGSNKCSTWGSYFGLGYRCWKGQVHHEWCKSYGYPFVWGSGISVNRYDTVTSVTCTRAGDSLHVHTSY